MDPAGMPIQKLSLSNLRALLNKLTKTDTIHLAMTNKWARDFIVAEKDIGISAWGQLTVNVWNKDYQSSIVLLENPFEPEEYAHINCRKEPLEKRHFEQKCLEYVGRQFRHLTVTRMDAKPIFFDDPIQPCTVTTEYIIRSLEAANVTCIHLHWNLDSHYSEAVRILKPKVIDCQNEEQLQRAMYDHFPIYRLHLINLSFYPQLMKYDYLSQYSKDITYDAFVDELDCVIKVFKSYEKPSELFVAWGDVDDFNLERFLGHWEAQGLHSFKYQKEGDNNLTVYWVEASQTATLNLPLALSCFLYKLPTCPSRTSYLFNCRCIKNLSDISFCLSGPKTFPHIALPWTNSSKRSTVIPKEFIEYKRNVLKTLNLTPE